LNDGCEGDTGYVYNGGPFVFKKGQTRYDYDYIYSSYLSLLAAEPPVSFEQGMSLLLLLFLTPRWEKLTEKHCRSDPVCPSTILEFGYVA
jgi:hypothetical protein